MFPQWYFDSPFPCNRAIYGPSDMNSMDSSSPMDTDYTGSAGPISGPPTGPAGSTSAAGTAGSPGFPGAPTTPMTPMTPMTPTTPATPTQQPSEAGFPSNFEIAPGSPTTLGVEYTQGYLKSQIGKRVRVTFLLGTNTIQDRTGILVDVGISYIVLRETETNSLVMADIYSIKFVNIFPD